MLPPTGSRYKQDAIEGSPTDDVTFQRGRRAIEKRGGSPGRNSGGPLSKIEETKKQKVLRDLLKSALPPWPVTDAIRCAEDV